MCVPFVLVGGWDKHDTNKLENNDENCMGHASAFVVVGREKDCEFIDPKLSEIVIGKRALGKAGFEIFAFHTL